MKTKSIRVTVGQKLGLPDYSSITMELTEEVELEEGESRKEVYLKLYRNLDKLVSKSLEDKTQEIKRKKNK